MEQFGLQLHPDKTRLIEFGRYAAERRDEAGRWASRRRSTFWASRIAAERRGRERSRSNANRSPSGMRAKLQEIKQQLRLRMHGAVSEVGSWLRSVVRGWFNYHAVPGNINCLDEFRTQVATSLAARTSEAKPERTLPGPGRGFAV